MKIISPSANTPATVRLVFFAPSDVSSFARISSKPLGQVAKILRIYIAIILRKIN
jgi:hypothetical protein